MCAGCIGVAAAQLLPLQGSCCGREEGQQQQLHPLDDDVAGIAVPTCHVPVVTQHTAVLSPPCCVKHLQYKHSSITAVGSSVRVAIVHDITASSQHCSSMLACNPSLSLMFKTPGHLLLMLRSANICTCAAAPATASLPPV
jgi:hypothetical protein